MSEEEEVQKALTMEEALAVIEEEQLDQARRAVRDAIVKQARELAEGAEEDFVVYGEDLAVRAVEAARAGDDLSLESLGRTTRMLAEKHKLRVKRGGWDLFEQVVLIVLQTAAGVLSSTLMKGKVI
jgi:hypothetical protein